MSTSDDPHDRIEEVSTLTADVPHLLTLAIPPGESTADALDRAERQHAETQYLHAETEARVSEALSALRDELDDGATSEDGLVVCAGVVEGDPVAYSFEAGSAVTEPRYERGEEFERDLLDDVGDSAGEAEADGESDAGGDSESQSSRTYGLLVVEHGKAALGRLADGEVTMLERFDRDRNEETPTSGEGGDDQAHREFFEHVAREAGRAFLDEERQGEATPDESEVDPVDGLFVGGSSVTASEFLDEEYLDHRLRNRVVGDAFAVGDATKDGLEQLAAKGRDRAEAAEREAVGELLETFFAELESGEEAVVGRGATEEALEYGGVETALVAETVSDEERRDLEERTASQGGELVAVPTDVEGGDRLREEGPVGALTRFPVE